MNEENETPDFASQNNDENEHQLTIDDTIWMHNDQKDSQASPQTSSTGFGFFKTSLLEPERRTPSVIVVNDSESLDINRDEPETRFDIRSNVRY